VPDIVDSPADAPSDLAFGAFSDDPPWVLDLAAIAWTPGLVLHRTLVRGADEARVAAPALPAAGYRETLARFGEVEETFAGVFVVDHRSDRHIHHDGFAIGAGAVAALAMPAALSLVLGVEVEFEKGVLMRVGHHLHIAAAPSVAAARAAFGDILLPAEGKAAVPAVAGFDQDPRFVDKHRKSRRLADKRRLAFLSDFQPDGTIPRRGCSRTCPCGRGL
jgi:hypothetical protein